MGIKTKRDKLSLLSINLVKVLDALTNSKPLTKTIYFTTNDPLNMNVDKSGEIFDPKSLVDDVANRRIYPYPFNVDFKDDKNIYLHVYYPDVEFKANENIEKAILFFDIVCHRDHWLFSQDGERLIRPYEIASYITILFDGTIKHDTLFDGTKVKDILVDDKKAKSDEYLGVINFDDVTHVTVNEQYDAIRLVSYITNF